jgi:hypothetical protein
VARAGEQIDTTVNPNLLPPATGTGGPARPVYSYQRTDLLTQGFTFGLEISF